MGNRAIAHSLLTCEKRGEMRNREIKWEGKLALFLQVMPKKGIRKKYFINIFTREGKYISIKESDNKLSHGRCLGNHIHIEQLQRETWGN